MRCVDNCITGARLVSMKMGRMRAQSRSYRRQICANILTSILMMQTIISDALSSGPPGAIALRPAEGTEYIHEQSNYQM